MRPYKICVITTSRSEYGLLYPIIKRIHEDDACELRLIVTGAHLEEEFGLTARDIDSDGFGIIHKVRIFQEVIHCESSKPCQMPFSGLEAYCMKSNHKWLLYWDRYDYYP